MSKRTKDISYLNRELQKINSKVLNDWLKEASDICPELESALEGIYCGEEGRIRESLGGQYEGLWITMGWYTVYKDPKVEYAYIN